MGYDWREYKKSADSYKTDSDSRYFSDPAGTSTNITDGSYGTQSFKTNGAYLRTNLPLSKLETLTLGARQQTYHQTSSAYYYNGGNTASCSPSYYCDPFSVDFNSSGHANSYETQYTRTIGPNTKSYIRASKNFRFANVDDNAQAPFSQNNNLKPQTSHDYEVGATYDDRRSFSTEVT